jgi:hypothetical protein
MSNALGKSVSPVWWAHYVVKRLDTKCARVNGHGMNRLASPAATCGSRVARVYMLRLTRQFKDVIDFSEPAYFNNFQANP